MKTLFKPALIFLFTLFVSANINAQNKFTGKITYQIGYEGLEGLGVNESMKSMLPTEMTFILKDGNSRSELKTGMGDQITIYDGKSKTVVNLIDMMGQKIAIKKSMDEIELDRKKYPDLKVTLSDETKTIAGYNCKKAQVEVNSPDFNGAATFTVYYTKELGSMGINFSDPLFNQIEGVMLEYEINTRGLLMKFTASDISKEQISDDLFSIPDGYKEMTPDELSKMFGR